MKALIKNVSKENVVKGKSRYTVSTVEYEYNGDTRSQRIFSFANPSVFKEVDNFVGKEVEITITKNDKGFDEWARIVLAEGNTGSGSGSTPAVSSGSTKVIGSNYETREERAQRQVYIIRQSSIANAIAALKIPNEPLDTASVLATAEAYVNYVMDIQPEAETEDLPF